MALSDRGSLTDVDGLAVGHFDKATRGWRTGTTVVLADTPVTAGVEVRGGGPGTRETDALAPWNLVESIEAICLSGGSAYGLRAADGVVDFLAAQGRGYPVGTLPHEVVPVVPAAVIFDLGRGGQFRNHPDASFGTQAAAKARAPQHRRGSIGAGIGALAGGLRGGVGMASRRVTLRTDDTTTLTATVGALCVVNARGSLINPSSGLPWEAQSDLKAPSRSERTTLQKYLATVAPPSFNTTIGVVATDLVLTRPEATRLAMSAHDGLSRAIRPVHTLADGDTMFSMATGRHELPTNDRTAAISRLLAASADCVAAACIDAVLHATSIGNIAAYRDLVPSAFR